MADPINSETKYYILSWIWITPAKNEELIALENNDEREKIYTEIMDTFKTTIPARARQVADTLEGPDKNNPRALDFVFINNDQAICFMFATKDGNLIQEFRADQSIIWQQLSKDDYDNRHAVFKITMSSGISRSPPAPS